MTISIPQAVFDKYNEVMDYFLTDNNFSRLCKVYYPPLREPCANCNINHLGGSSSNVYQHGGPAPFSNLGCGYCGGNGYRETEVTDTLRLRIYWSKKDWITNSATLGGGRFSLSDDSIVIGGSLAQCIGSIDDLPKILRAKEIQLLNEQKELDQRFVLASEPFLHGFGKTRYFVVYIKRC